MLITIATLKKNTFGKIDVAVFQMRDCVFDKGTKAQKLIY